MKRFIFYLLLLCTAGYVYVIIELCYRQKTDVTMMFCASICAIPMIFLNNIFSYELDFLIQILLCGSFCTVTELIFGLNFNSDYHIWDYSNMILNYKGQICIVFFFVWVLLSIPIIIMADWMEYYVFDLSSQQPYYKIFRKEVYRMKHNNRIRFIKRG